MSASPTDERRKRIRIRRIRTISSLAFFPLLIFYYEMVLHKLTVKELDRPSFIYILLFSISLGFILYLFRSILPFRRLVIVTELLIFLLMLPYLVEMFVFRKFNIFYDINTIKGGAGGVATGFMGDVFRMVFSLGGLVRLFFLFFPLF